MRILLCHRKGGQSHDGAYRGTFRLEAILLSRMVCCKFILKGSDSIDHGQHVHTAGTCRFERAICKDILKRTVPKKFIALRVGKSNYVGRLKLFELTTNLST